MAFASEVAIALQIDHPHVARLEDVYESSRRIHMVMECLSGGNLCEYLRDMGGFIPEALIAQVVLQMLLAVNYLHKQGIVHRDLKLANFVFQGPGLGDGLLKLIDFGMSQKLEPGAQLDKNCGTMGYKAPEVLNRCYTSRCDLWSLGVIVFRLFMNHMPFGGSDRDEVAHNISNLTVHINDVRRWDHVSAGAKDFLGNLLVLEPSERMTAEQALAHPWVAARRRCEMGPRLLDTALLDAVRSHARASPCRRACLRVASWALAEEERQEAAAALKRLDASHAGTLKVDQLLHACCASRELGPAQLRGLALSLDEAGGRGEIGYSTLLAVLVSSKGPLDDRMVHETFRRLDADRDGYITEPDLRAVLGDSFEGVPVGDLLQELGAGRRGRVSLADFARYLAQGAEEAEEDEDEEENETAEML